MAALSTNKPDVAHFRLQLFFLSSNTASEEPISFTTDYINTRPCLVSSYKLIQIAGGNVIASGSTLKRSMSMRRSFQSVPSCCHTSVKKAGGVLRHPT